MTKNQSDIKDPEYGVDSRYNSKKTKIEDGKLLMQARLDRLNNVTPKEIINARLLQLKLKMESYLEQDNDQEAPQFNGFLKTYIDTLYEKRNKFANDIGMTPVSLSQVLNNHREPQEEFMLRLMLHSEIVYKDICKFDERTWYQIYFHEKILSTMSKQSEWKPKVAQYVKFEESY